MKRMKLGKYSIDIPHFELLFLDIEWISFPNLKSTYYKWESNSDSLIIMFQFW